MLLIDLMEMSNRELFAAGQQINAIFSDLGFEVRFTQHVMNRLLDIGDNARREYDNKQYARDTDIKIEELVAVFTTAKRKYHELFRRIRNNPSNYYAVIMDANTKLNIAFVLDSNTHHKKLRPMVVRTIMRKANFKNDHNNAEELHITTDIRK